MRLTITDAQEVQNLELLNASRHNTKDKIFKTLKNTQTYKRQNTQLTKDKNQNTQTYKRQNAQETQKKKDQETKEVHQGNRRSV